jgi:hypothetical protein
MFGRLQAGRLLGFPHPIWVPAWPNGVAESVKPTVHRSHFACPMGDPQPIKRDTHA